MSKEKLLMSSTVLSISENAPLVKELTSSQLANFIAAVWNCESYKSWAEPKAMWLGIAKLEAEREFTEGWSYCDSKLLLGGKERTWRYQTTSGTIIEISQTRYRCGDVLPAPVIRVTIPAHRVNGYHAELLLDAIDGRDFYTWGNLFYANEGTPQSTEAKRLGMPIANVRRQPTDESEGGTLTLLAAESRGEDYEEDEEFEERSDSKELDYFEY